MSKRIEYIRGDKSLTEKFRRAGNLVQKFNSTNYEDDDLRREILYELFGSVDEGISIEHNFHYDLGYNIHVLYRTHLKFGKDLRKWDKIIRSADKKRELKSTDL